MSGSKKTTKIDSVIAIDGPGAGGKTTVGRLLADRLGFLFIDTGLMYRAVTLAALEGCVNTSDEAEVIALAQSIDIKIQPANRKVGPDSETVLVDGRDVSNEIKTPAVDRQVSIVSKYSGVRDAMVDQQRTLACAGQVVMAGRDIGTVVLADAKLKIYLTASAESRAQRRYLELKEMQLDVDLASILSDLQRRDKIDSEREESPLRPALDSILVDTSQMTPAQVVDRIVHLWRQVNY